MGVLPARSPASFASSTSTQVTECPVSAKQVPATRPTYPVPTTAMRIDPFSRLQLVCFILAQPHSGQPLRKANRRWPAHLNGHRDVRQESPFSARYSTVTLFARLRGWSTFLPR